MNEQTTKLIEQLAQKLGTTSQYLWSVLLKQAPIDATVTLLQSLFVVFFGVVLFKAHKRLSKKESQDRYAQTGYEKHEIIAVPMIIAGIIFIILCIISFCCIGDIFNGYFNPEYWALDRILNK